MSMIAAAGGLYLPAPERGKPTNCPHQQGLELGGARVSWDPSNAAHSQTWGFLFFRRELIATFPEAKQRKVASMTFWNHAASNDLNLVAAGQLASMMHDFFRDQMKCPYEDGYALGRSVVELTEVLAHGANTIPDIGNKIDDIFRFQGER